MGDKIWTGIVSNDAVCMYEGAIARNWCNGTVVNAISEFNSWQNFDNISQH